MPGQEECHGKNSRTVGVHKLLSTYAVTTEGKGLPEKRMTIMPPKKETLVGTVAFLRQ